MFELLRLMEKFVPINAFLMDTHIQSKFPVHSLKPHLKAKRVFLMNSIAKTIMCSFRSTFQVSKSFLEEEH